MSYLDRIAIEGNQKVSPLVLCDHLLGLAQEADQAGFPVEAEHLLYLAYGLFDDDLRLQ